VSIELPFPEGRWSKRLDSAEARWEGPGSCLPALFVSKDGVRLVLAAESVSLYYRLKGG
jgi:hypothetical protein